MDTLLVNGDHYTDARGLPMGIGGDSALMQQVLIRLSMPRGALAHEPDLGSELHKLRGARTQALDRLALSYAQQALLPMANVAVQGVQVTRGTGEGMTVAVALACQGQAYRLEVEVA